MKGMIRIRIPEIHVSKVMLKDQGMKGTIDFLVKNHIRPRIKQTLEGKPHHSVLVFKNGSKITFTGGSKEKFRSA